MQVNILKSPKTDSTTINQKSIESRLHKLNLQTYTSFKISPEFTIVIRVHVYFACASVKGVLPAFSHYEICRSYAYSKLYNRPRAHYTSLQLTATFSNHSLSFPSIFMQMKEKSFSYFLLANQIVLVLIYSPSRCIAFSLSF